MRPLAPTPTALGGNSQPALIIPVHNRRETTLACLARLHELGIPAWAEPVIVDDGSTDGTAEAIRRHFPNTTILRGDGNLWWTGAIARGMDHALRNRAELIFWLNDDCLPAPGVLERLADLVREHRGAATAQSLTPRGYIYGGQRKTRWGMAPFVISGPRAAPCDAFTGNCVCLHPDAVRAVGLPRADLVRQCLGDADYALRLRVAGFPLFVLGEPLCTNQHNFDPTVRSWLLSDVPLSTLWKATQNPKSALHLPTAWHFHTTHWGAWGLVLFAWPYLRLTTISLLRLLIPRPLLLALYGKHSLAWTSEIDRLPPSH